MKLQKKVVHAVAAAAIATAFAAPAMADTVNLSNYVFTPAQSLNVSIAAPAKTYNGGAGQFTGLLNGNSFQTYCTDLYQTFHFNTNYTNYSVVSGVTAWGATKSLAMDKLISYSLASGNTPTNAAQSAVLQAAIWEVLYETGTYGFSAGNFTATSAIGATQTLLNNFDWAAVANTTVTHHVDQLYSAKNQDFMVITAVPEPGTYAMLLAGLGLMGTIARRRSRKA